MGKKNMDILLGNILGNAAIKPQDRYEEPAAPLPENDAPAPSTKGTDSKAFFVGNGLHLVHKGF